MKTCMRPAALLAAALFVCAPGAQAQDDAPLTPASHMKVDMGGGTSGLKRLAIPTFMVQFVRDQGIERDAGTFGMFQGQSATFFTQVRGADPAVLQQVADGLYDALVADLKAAGIEVVPQAELDAHPDYQEIRKIARPSPFTDAFNTGTRRDKRMGVNVFVSARGLPLVLRTVADRRWLDSGYGAEGLSGMTLVLGPGKVAQSLKAGMLNVRLTIAMVEQKGKGWGGVSARPDFVLNRWVRTASSGWEFETDPFARYVEAGTLFALTNGGTDLNPNPWVMALSQPVPIVGLEISGTKGEGGNARGSGLLGAIARAATGGDTTAADLYIDVQPANFVERSLTDGKRVVRLMTEAIATGLK